MTPSYNQAAFIEETIRSVLLQGYPDLEYIIIDGGSTDGSVDVIRKYEPWLSYWESEPDRGQSHAINKGFAQATGEVVAWLNSDDTLLPQALTRVADAFLRHPEVGLVYGDHLATDTHGTVLMRHRTPDFTLRSLAVYNWIAQGFVRAQAVPGARLVCDDLHYLMDWQLWLSVAMNHPVLRIPYSLARVRFHPGAKTVSARSGFIEEQRKLLEWLYSRPALPPELAQMRSVSCAAYQYALAVEAYRSGSRRKTAICVLRSFVSHPLRPSVAKRLAYLLAAFLPRKATDRVGRLLREQGYPASFLDATGVDGPCSVP